MSEALTTTTPDVCFASITRDSVHHLRNMNASIFPIRYGDSFYKNLPNGNPDLNQLAYVDGIFVGAVCCRIEPAHKDTTQERLYIMTLGVLATWRRHGVGTQLLLRILNTLKRYPAIHEVYLHVQTSNQEAVQFYKAHDFSIEETIKNYYKRADPPDCYLLRRRISEEDEHR